MFARIDGAHPEYTARTPHILAPRRISLPSILGNMLPISLQNRAGWPFPLEELARIDDCFPEWMAKTPSTLR